MITYDALNPEHLIKKQTIKANSDLQYLLLDQKRRSLLVFAAHEEMRGKVTNERLLRYPLKRRGQASIGHLTTYARNGIKSADTLAGRFVVGNEDSTLTVHQIENNGVLRPVSRQPILKVVAANSPSRIVYRRAGSFLYIGTYESTGDPRITASPSPIIVCRLSSDGHLSGQEQTGQPVSNPRPYLDNTGRFLYIVSMEGPLASYKIDTDGHLWQSGSHIKIPAPTGMVFFGGAASHRQN